MARTTKRTPAPAAGEHEETSPDGYEQVFAGQPFTQPEGKNWDLACCHCGLVHSVKIEHDGLTRDGGELKITMRENAAATKRHRKIAGEAPALDEAYAKGYRDGLRAAARTRQMWQQAQRITAQRPFRESASYRPGGPDSDEIEDL